MSAPTGAGKTLIAEFAIYRALAAQRRIIYTTPLKALSNQKYSDFIRQYGGDLVGILTGDVKVNPGAPILVMTTEILRNLLFTERPQDIATAVLDECHYLGDEGRGHRLGRDRHQRAADDPTGGALGDGQQPARDRRLDRRGAPAHPSHRPHGAAGPAAVPPLPPGRRDRDAGRARIARRRPRPGCGCAPAGRAATGTPSAGTGSAAGPPARTGSSRSSASGGGSRPSTSSSAGRGASAHCDAILEDGDSLLAPERRAEVDEAIANTLRDYPSIVAETEVNALLFDGLRRGAGMHHAGILPALKRLTEVLFERGLVKVVFATETMSLGIHMPARSVVIQGVRKRSEAGFRRLTPERADADGGPRRPPRDRPRGEVPDRPRQPRGGGRHAPAARAARPSRSRASSAWATARPPCWWTCTASRPPSAGSSSPASASSRTAGRWCAWRRSGRSC